jgi:predicted ATPase
MIKLNSYGREYVYYLLSEINLKHCYPSVLKYIKSMKTEVQETGNTTEKDVLKLRQIFYRTNNDTPPKTPEYHLFEEMY